MARLRMLGMLAAILVLQALAMEASADKNHKHKHGDKYKHDKHKHEGKHPNKKPPKRLCDANKAPSLVADPKQKGVFHVCENGTDTTVQCAPGYTFKSGKGCTPTSTKADATVAIQVSETGAFTSDTQSWNAVSQACTRYGDRPIAVKAGSGVILVDRVSVGYNIIRARLNPTVRVITYGGRNYSLSDISITVNWKLLPARGDRQACSELEFTEETMNAIDYPPELRPVTLGRRRALGGSKWCCWVKVLKLAFSSVTCVTNIIAIFSGAPPVMAIMTCGVAYSDARGVSDCFKQSDPCTIKKIIGCFPSDAQLRLPSGLPMRMDKLAIGDRVAAPPRAIGLSRPMFEDVYLFGHRDASAVAPFISLTLANNASVSLTERHFIPIRRHSAPSQQLYTYAGSVQPGDEVLTFDPHSSTYVYTMVVRTVVEMKVGLYNPFTIGGNIEVNGVVASSHSNWYLDGMVPASMNKYLPGIYQLSLTPVRSVYKVIGPKAMRDLDEKYNFAEVAPNGEFVPYVTSLISVAASGFV